jgi:hypothetical protein
MAAGCCSGSDEGCDEDSVHIMKLRGVKRTSYSGTY